MKRLLQINTVAAGGSTGKIVESIGRMAIADGWESWIAYGRGNPKSESNLIRIGNDADMMWHGLQTRLFDRHGLASKKATKTFIKEIKKINPDLIHLHNIHGYYLNYPLLFKFLKEWGGPVVWTLHDCWAFTGHCTNFQNPKCDKWMCGCNKCSQPYDYPKSWHKDRSDINFTEKRLTFRSIIKQLTIVAVSEWLKDSIKKSFLSEARITAIHNGIDLNAFKPYSTDTSENVILGVANVWSDKKGIDEFIFLREQLPENCKIILVGMTQKQIKSLPSGITGIGKTNSQQELARLYSSATVFVNPTKEETLSLTNIEAQACGTPVVCYATGGTPETVSSETGILIPSGDKEKLLDAVTRLLETPKCGLAEACRKRAVRLFDQKDRFAEYISLYNSLLGR